MFAFLFLFSGLMVVSVGGSSARQIEHRAGGE
jgi:hypothetical protein